MNKVLMYHSIGGSSGEVGSGLYSVSVEKFKEQMEYVKKSTHAITFDDGLLDNYTLAYPILKELALKAYFFILVASVGEAGYMNWEQIRNLSHNGMIIGSHGMTHRILTNLREDKLDYEICQSKTILETNLGIKINYFSVPRGFYNQKIIQKIKEAGYKKVFTSAANEVGEFKVGRISIKAGWDLKRFISVLDRGLSLSEKAGEIFKDSSKKILGAVGYDRLRTRILK